MRRGGNNHCQAHKQGGSWISHSLFMKFFDPSDVSASAEGPNLGMPALTRSLTRQATKGASGPITTSPTLHHHHHPAPSAPTGGWTPTCCTHRGERHPQSAACTHQGDKPPSTAATGGERPPLCQHPAATGGARHLLLPFKDRGRTPGGLFTSYCAVSFF